jgi:signal transduction histidine kinase
VADREPAAASFGAEVLGGGCAAAVLPDSRYDFDAALLSAGVGSLVAVPMAAADGARPVIVAAWTTPRSCPREDVWFLEVLSAQMALALRNAALYSDLRQAALAEREAQAQVGRSARMRELGDAAAGLAHAFNNSLTSILGLADWSLLALPPGEPTRGEVQSIRDQAMGMAALVRRLQDFSRVEPEGEAPARVDPVDLAGELIVRARQMVEERSVQCQATFDLVTDIAAAPAIRVAASRVRQAWLHLVENALDAMPAGGRVTICCRAAAGAVRLGVADEGPGMPAEVKAQASQPFFTTKGGAHAGLGLTVALATAERQGGTLELFCPGGGGTAAWLVFPSDD